MIPADWLPSALCAQSDPELFHPDKGGSPLPAKRICDRCEVRSPCLTEAMQREADGQLRDGVYGGLSPNERGRLAATGWARGDVTPSVRLFHRPPDPGACPHCQQPCRSVRMHVASVHPGVRGAA